MLVGSLCISWNTNFILVKIKFWLVFSQNSTIKTCFFLINYPKLKNVINGIIAQISCTSSCCFYKVSNTYSGSNTILGLILKKLIYLVQKWQNFNSRLTKSSSNRSAWNCLQKLFLVPFNFVFTGWDFRVPKFITLIQYIPFSSCRLWYN